MQIMATITVTKNVRRVTVRKKKCPNPLFIKWIKEWIAEAVSKDTKVRFGYRKALHSLQNYPLVLHSGKDCAILQDFGPKLCARLDQRLAEYVASHGSTKKTKPTSTRIPKMSNSSANKNPAASTNKPSSALQPAGVPPAPLQPPQAAAKPKPSSLPSATDRSSGFPPASVKPPQAAKRPATIPKSPAKKTKKVVESQSDDDLILPPGSFDVLLVVDNAEVFGNTKTNESATKQELTALGVKFDVRSLKVGDYAWVARDLRSGSELILPYVVERKRLDDLACSIKDGRYREQKFRLRQCGLSNLIYLIESAGKGDLHAGLPLSTLQQASINTEVHGDFIVKHVASHHMSMLYLATMTALITRIFKDKVLVKCKKDNLPQSNINDDVVSLMSFLEFNKAASKIKKWRVRDMLIKHLIQLRGVSVEKAVAIAEHYPSPRSLLAAYSQTDSGEKLLAKITYGEQKRSIGPVISTAVYRLYTMDQFP